MKKLFLAALALIAAIPYVTALELANRDEVDNWILQKSNELQNIDCSSQTDCTLQTVYFNDGQFDSSKSDPTQTILVLDSYLDFPATIRYRSRVKAAFNINNGIYQQHNPSIELPAFIKTILTEADNFKGANQQPVFVPAEWLDEMYYSINPYYGFGDFFQDIGHGTIPFLYLLEHNPEAEFVIAPSPEFFRDNQNLFCNPNDSNINELTNRVITATQSFVQDVLINQDIEYVNYSGGYTQKTVESRWQELCGGWVSSENAEKLLNTLEPFFTALYTQAGVFSFQATDIDMTISNNPFDIDPFDLYFNRMLVGDYTTGRRDSGLPSDGIQEFNLLPRLKHNRMNSIQWIDYFVNFGIEQRRPFRTNDTPMMEVDSLGFGTFPISSVQPSWASPAALSRAIHVKNSVLNQKYAELTDTLIKQIWGIMTPEGVSTSTPLCDWNTLGIGYICKRQDPLKHYQQELFELVGESQ